MPACGFQKAVFHSSQSDSEEMKPVTECWTNYRVFFFCFFKASTKYQTEDQCVLVTAVRRE